LRGEEREGRVAAAAEPVGGHPRPTMNEGNEVGQSRGDCARRR
jgi:hypothetical protein